MPDIALFPIPDCVTFPGTVFPLHVFEPRYRTMINHCLAEDMLLGICHTQKTLSPGKENQSLQESLQSNQATYKPHTIFSAGHCELIKILGDGRIYLKVHLKKRYRLMDQKQLLPFLIYACDEYNDMVTDQAINNDAILLKEKILNRLQILTANIPDAQAVLSSNEWIEKDVSQFSFEIFGLMQFDADTQQQILEMDNSQKRLKFFLSLLNQNY